MILSGFADIWLLPAVPFLSARVIGCVRSLWKLTASHHVVTRPIGILGLGCLLAGLTGLLSPVPALPLILLGGAVSGFAMLSVRGADPDLTTGVTTMTSCLGATILLRGCASMR